MFYPFDRKVYGVYNETEVISVKKIAVILSVILSVSLCACREDSPRSTSDSSSASHSTESISQQTQSEETSTSGQANPYSGLKEAFDGEYTVGELMGLDGENGSLTIYDTENGENVSFTFDGKISNVFVLDRLGIYCHMGQMVRVYHSGGSALIAIPDSEVTRLEMLITTGENPTTEQIEQYKNRQ